MPGVKRVLKHRPASLHVQRQRPRRLGGRPRQPVLGRASACRSWRAATSPRAGPRWRSISASRSRPSAPTGARAAISASSPSVSPRTRRTRSRPCSTVHNETATGMVLPVADIRRAMDEAKHPALLLSDTISSLASIDYRMDAWGIDVTVGGSQKGLMLPTGMSFTGVSQQGPGGRAQEQGAAALLELGPDERPRAAEVHRHRAGAHVLRPAGIAQDDRGGRPRRGVRAPYAAGRGDARGGARLGRRRQGPAALLPVARPALQLGDHGDDARGRELRSACARSRSTATTCRSAAGWGR